jgi:hypothetical protein
MPLFSSRHEEPIQDPPADAPKRRSTLFGRNRDVSPTSTSRTSRSSTTHNNNNNSASPRRSGLLHRRDEDPTIIAARERVQNAEAAERDADRALAAARVAVREAREHIKRLEREAAEEARLARIKQDQAMSMTKRGKGLGRRLPLLCCESDGEVYADGFVF